MMWEETQKGQVLISDIKLFLLSLGEGHLLSEMEALFKLLWPCQPQMQQAKDFSARRAK
jgi:hypothetical protein